MKKIIRSEKAPAPVGPYNQAIVHNDTLYTVSYTHLDVYKRQVQSNLEPKAFVWKK